MVANNVDHAILRVREVGARQHGVLLAEGGGGGGGMRLP